MKAEGVSKITMKSKKRKALLIFLAAALVLGIQSVPAGLGFGGSNAVYGTTMWVTSKIVGAASAVQGDEKVAVIIEVENKENGNFIFDSAELAFSSLNGITVSGTTGTITLAKGQKANLSFSVDVARGAASGSRTMKLILRNEGSTVHENGAVGKFTIYEKVASDSSKEVAALDIAHSTSPEGGFASGQENILYLEIFNNGNTRLENSVLTLTMPEGLSLDNASNSEALGYIGMGSRRSVSFPILVESNAATKTHAITAEITGLSYTNQSVSVKKTFYVPVNGSAGAVNKAEIVNIITPSQVSGEEEFTLSFDVKNQNSTELKNVKIDVEVPEGLLNKSRTTFIESSIAGGSTKNYSVRMFAQDGAKEKAYTIKISLSSNASSEGADTVTQYASVYVSGAGGEKTPQLMVDSYSYGGTFVQAGDQFALRLGLYNASGSRSISNIKITISSDDGAIIPVNSSNSFYIEKLGKKERTEQVLSLSVKPNAEQKTTPLTVDMSYEDGSGNTFTSKDLISIPIMQETRLEVDDIIAPPELFPGMQTGVSLQFYNTGKTTLSNLRITAEGDFDTPESTSYFVGNLESGKSDSYDFSFIPRKGGALEGKVVFSYEDASGDVQILERPFSFQVMEEMPVFDGGMPPDMGMDDQGGSKTPWIVGGIIWLLVIAGIIVWLKLRKRKKQREMEINE